MGGGVPKSGTVYPKLSPWLRTRATVLPTALKIQRTKGWPSFFFKQAPVGIGEQLLFELCLDSASIFIIYLKRDG